MKRIMLKIATVASHKLSKTQTAAAMVAIAAALLSMGAASIEQLSVDYSTRACAQNVNFTGSTCQRNGVAISTLALGVSPTTAYAGDSGAAAYAAAVTNATNSNTVSTIVKRDSSGNFAAGTITAALTGTASGNLSNAVITSGAGTPSTTPAAAGYIYIDTSGNKAYFSVGAVDSGSWKTW